MKKLLIPLLAVALLCAGCATTTPTSTDLSNTIALLNATVPLAVAVVAEREPQTVKDFQGAALVLDTLAGDTNTTPGQVVKAIDDLGLSQDAKLAVLCGVGLWQAYLSQHPGTLPEQSRLLLSSVAADIRSGLPPINTVTILRAKRANAAK